MNDALNLFFTLTGRINRARLWLGFGIVALATVVFAFVATSLLEDLGARFAAYYEGAEFTFAGGDFIIAAWILFIAYMLVALSAKRLHDRDRSAWWVLAYIPLPIVVYLGGFMLDPPANTTVPTLRLGDVFAVLVAAWWFIEIGTMRGTKGANRFGPDPLSKGSDEAVVRAEPIRLSDVGAFIMRGLDWKAMIVLGASGRRRDHRAELRQLAGLAVPYRQQQHDPLRQVPLLRPAGVVGRSRLGLWRHPVARSCRVLLARRLRHGHVSDASDRLARRLRQPCPAGLHGVPELGSPAVVLVRLQQFLVRRV